MYRADGMRVKKVDGLTIDWNPADEQHASGWYDENQAVNKDTTRFYYDGQMGMEEDRTYTTTNGTHVDVTRYGVGARGIDFMQLFTDATSQWVKFPLYDGHGNMVSTVVRAGSGNSSFTVGDSRSYDVWGLVRSGSASGSPDQRYCASLGHRVDDESEGLIYMRARYYEPWTGRFVSRDPAKHGFNWFVYATNNPIRYLDFDGNHADGEDFSWYAFKAVMWYFFPSPFVTNPFLQGALDCWENRPVDLVWVNRLDDYLNQWHKTDALNALSLLSFVAGPLKPFAGLINVVTAINAYVFTYWVAIISCEIAFEEGR